MIDFFSSARQMAKVCVEERHGGSLLRELKPGITALIALGILETLQEQEIIKPLLEMEHNSPEYLHVLVEVMRFVSVSPA